MDPREALIELLESIAARDVSGAEDALELALRQAAVQAELIGRAA